MLSTMRLGGGGRAGGRRSHQGPRAEEAIHHRQRPRGMRKSDLQFGRVGEGRWPVAEEAIPLTTSPIPPSRLFVHTPDLLSHQPSASPCLAGIAPNQFPKSDFLCSSQTYRTLSGMSTGIICCLLPTNALSWNLLSSLPPTSEPTSPKN